MLTKLEANTLKNALSILKREGDYATKTSGDAESAYVAGQADMVAESLFDYLNSAKHFADDENAGRAIA